MANTLKFGNGEWYGKKDTILAYNDLNSNYKPLPFDFSRDSSATVVNKDGLIETVGSGQPRIDYKDDSKGALLLEPSRTNLVTYSEDIFNFSTSNLNVTINSNQTTSPSGGLADKIEENNVDGNHAARRLSGISVVASQSYTFSFFAKKDERSVVGISNTIGGNGKSAFIDIENGVILSSDFSTSSIENYGNGWYKINLTDTATNDTDYDVRIYTSIQDGSFSHQGVVGYGFYIWGVQLEQGSYATSYIPTQGSSVTRLADNIDTDFGTILPLSGEVSVYMEMLGQPVNETNVTGKISAVNFDDTTDSSSYVSLNFNGTDWRARVQAVGGSRFVSFEVDQTETIKALFVLRPTSYALYANGNLIGSEDRLYNEPAPVINEIAKVEFDNSTSDKGITRNKDLRVYNTALSNAEAIALTQV